MDAARWRHAFDLFNQAIAQGLDQRSAWLSAACDDDTDLLAAVERLIAAHESARDFLEVPAALHLLTADRALAPEGDGLGPDSGRLFDTSALLADVVGGAPFESDRFALRHVIGAGGMGIVYNAYDRERRQVVALKTLRRTSPSEIFYLKREFRALSGIAHRNLVSLYELVIDGAACFFTMELVDGVDVVAALQGPPTPARFARIRDIFGQLAEGLFALHDHGRLHRDIKPSNVLVESEDRVVILDFGLITDTGTEASSGLGARVAGTPAYMAPEDIAGTRASELSDWYSVGITLYETLTGRVPFEGPFEEQHRRKTQEDPPEPATIVRDVPDDLNRLCVDLMSRNRERRQPAADRLRRQTRAGSPNIQTSRSLDVEGEATFVGRSAALAVLDRAFATVQSGETAVSVLIHGPSGIGKSALVRRFLAPLLTSATVVVLRGRCYEQEAVPYKALDGIIDSLGQYLSGLSNAERAQLLPPDLPALAQMFPVLAQVDLSDRPPSTQPAVDPIALRHRGIAALRQLLAALARRHRVILFVDDLHWADADSAALLADLLHPPSAPALLTLLCFRSEESAAKPFLETLLGDVGSDARVSLALDPLSDVDADALIESLGVHASIGSAHRERMTRDAEGNPLLLKQVAHYVAGVGADSGESLNFAAMLTARVEVLPPMARQFLDALAICARPTAPDVIFQACGFAGDERPLVASLRSAHLIRSSGSAARVELYHDRIRSALATMVLPEDVRRIHLSMADALVGRPVADPEDLFGHYVGAGDHDRASVEAARAAARAGDALAFERAAHFYRRALALSPASSAALAWTRGLALALVNAGRPAEAADCYLKAADKSDAGERIDLQRRAAEQLLVGGHIDRGLAVIRSVLAAARVPLRRGPRAAFLSLMVARLRLWRRGLASTPRAERDIAERDLRRIDTCWSVVTGLSMVDPIRAADCQTRHLVLALDAGEPYRMARALALQVGFQAAGHGLIGKGSFVAPGEALRVAERVGHPHAIALATLTSGMSAAMVGEWRRSATLSERALDILREQCVGVTWEINQATFFLLGSMLYLGELREVSARLPELLASAKERGNLYFETELRTRMNLVWLAADDPDEGARQANGAIEAWSHEGFQRQHYNLALALVQTTLYRGDADAAWQLISRSWVSMKRTFLFRIPILRVETSYMRARCALQQAQREPASGFLAIARRDIRRIRRERQMVWSAPIATLLDAGVAFREGRVESAVRDLERAADEFTRADMHLYVAAARRRLGAIVGGATGDEMIRAADEWMAAQQIRNPVAMVRLLAAGFPD